MYFKFAERVGRKTAAITKLNSRLLIPLVKDQTGAFALRTSLSAACVFDQRRTEKA
jgi:hypothetical protein